MIRSLRTTLAGLASCMMTLQIAAAGSHLGHGGTCNAPCGEVVYQEVPCKVCKPVPDKKKTTKVVYECKEEWYCLPKCPCPLHIGKHDCCDSCGNHCLTCEKPRCRRILVKKIITEEVPTTKCVVENGTQTVPCTIR
jgi:hypothetical protein